MDITNLEESLYPNPNPNPNLNQKQSKEEEAGMRAGKIANAVAFPMVLKAALRIGVIDAISAAGEGSWLSPLEIARRLGSKPTNPQAPMLLDRMLRVLASYSVVKSRTVQTGETERVYAAGSILPFLLKENEDSGSLVPLFMMLQSDVFFKMWNHLNDTILDGRDAFTCAHGMGIYDYLRKDEQFHDLFHRAMSGHSTMIMKKVLEVYKGFEGTNVLVDVGGSDGTSISLIVSKYPHVRGINFDLPDAVEKASPYPGVEHVAGDMFVEVPKGDTIFMKRLIHGWNDEDCVKILKNCWRSLPDRGKAIIVETIIPTNPKEDDIYSKFGFDLDMLVLVLCDGGKERTRAEFETLAEKAGFARCEFVSRAFYCWVIELYKEIDA